jgi:hypothetical protein
MKYKQLILGIIIGVVVTISVQFVGNMGGEVKELYQEIKGIGIKPYPTWHSDRKCKDFNGLLLSTDTDKEEIRKRLKSGLFLCNKCITDKMIKWAEEDEE